VCRQLGIVEKTFYRWREKYAGMEATEARRLRELEDQKWAPEYALGRADARKRSAQGRALKKW